MDEAIASSSKALREMLQKVERLIGSDGTTLSLTKLLVRGFDLTGHRASEGIVGTNMLDRINGLDG